MVHYAECASCRRASCSRYFGEEWPDATCGGCDNCLTPRETFDGTLAAQKLLSCVFRVKQKTGFTFGLNHMIEVLVGAENENVRKWGHDGISVYGIGKEMKRAEWQAIGRELIRLGLLRQSSEKFATVELTAAGLDVLKTRRALTLTKPVIVSEKERRAPRSRRGEIACDEELFERLRKLRRRLADERDVPAYIIFSDVTLREMAARLPKTTDEFAQIPGVGKQKLEVFSQTFLEEIASAG